MPPTSVFLYIASCCSATGSGRVSERECSECCPIAAAHFWSVAHPSNRLATTGTRSTILHLCLQYRFFHKLSRRQQHYCSRDCTARVEFPRHRIHGMRCPCCGPAPQKMCAYSSPDTCAVAALPAGGRRDIAQPYGNAWLWCRYSTPPGRNP